ncbi:MAG: hypothetical protein QOD07_2091 [Frankiaceae bacterium]|nr:hypothetical protein [Frankiaceae bacterium]
MNENVAAALARIATDTGVPLNYDGSQLLVGGQAVPLPGDAGPELAGERAQLLGIEGLLPTVPHGDDRDKLLWHVIAEAAPDIGEPLLNDFELRETLASMLPFNAEASRVAAEALCGRFFSSKSAAVMLPVHASLPLNYRHARKVLTGKRAGETTDIGYTMFSGGILPYLLWDTTSGGPSVGTIQNMLDAVGGERELTVLDRRFLEIALADAPRPSAAPDASELVREYKNEFKAEFASVGGPFCEPSLALFARDLEVVLETELPRPERIEWLTLVVSLHLALRLYRVAVALGGELDAVVAAAAQLPAPEGARGCTCTGRDLEQLQECPLAGMVRFRTGSGHFRRVTGSDGCRVSYIELDRRRLLDLLPTLITRNLAARAWSALGGGDAAARRDMRALTDALDADADLRRMHGAACAAIAVLHHDACRKGNATQDELFRAARTSEMRPGVHALREDVRRMRSRDLRRISTSVVNSLVFAGTVGRGSFVSRNGPNYGFFEVDEQLLLLLVRVVCGDRELPFETFLIELRAYGLAPQDAAEEEALADTLERLGLLDRYSDAGEASFVHYA